MHKSYDCTFYISSFYVPPLKSCCLKIQQKVCRSNRGTAIFIAKMNATENLVDGFRKAVKAKKNLRLQLTEFTPKFEATQSTSDNWQRNFMVLMIKSKLFDKFIDIIFFERCSWSYKKKSEKKSIYFHNPHDNAKTANIMMIESLSLSVKYTRCTDSNRVFCSTQSENVAFTVDRRQKIMKKGEKNYFTRRRTRTQRLQTINDFYVLFPSFVGISFLLCSSGSSGIGHHTKAEHTQEPHNFSATFIITFFFRSRFFSLLGIKCEGTFCFCKTQDT